MLTNTGTAGYVQRLKEGKDILEIDVVLMAIFFDLELEIYYVEDLKVKKQSFKLYSNTTNERKTIKLYLRPDCRFDTVYNKHNQKSNAISQSIILDVTVLFTFSWCIVCSAIASQVAITQLTRTLNINIGR